MRSFFLPILFILLFSDTVLSQTNEMDSLKKEVLSHPARDTARVDRLILLGFEARKSTPKISYDSYAEALELSRSLGYKKGEGMALLGLGFYYRFQGDQMQGLEYTLKSIPLFQELNDTLQVIAAYYNLITSYSHMANFESALKYGLDGLKLAEFKGNSKWLILMNYQMGNLYMEMKEMEKGADYFRKSLIQAEKSNDLDGMAHAYGGYGWIYELKKNWDSSIFFYSKQLELSKKMSDPRGMLQNELDILNIQGYKGQYEKVFARIYDVMAKFNEYGQVGYLPYLYNVLARVHLENNRPDSALFYSFKAVNATMKSGRVVSYGFLMQTIAQAYAKKNDFKEAYRYQQLFTNYMDSLNLSDAVKKFGAMQYSFELDKKESQIQLLKNNEELTAKQNRQQKVVLFGSLAGLLILVIFSVVLWRNNKQRHRAYVRLEQQQEQLKQTQTQLIHSEKMASLGELTAGIAHEIQNPLNFVNNFSDVNRELLTELQEEINNKNYGEVNTLAADVIANEEKISYHGKRADSIVKSMLQHSRSNSGQKELSDINLLVDECLRLSFHGMRAKDKSFNLEIDTSFQSDLPRANIVSQDIGRVLLNLFTNAFYSLSQKKNASQENFEPHIAVRTEKQNNSIVISVKDNGNGIPQPVIDKIFQPFFTTKPTGEGTGLGLSMSFDIISKGHGGQLKVESEEGKYAAFTIIFPI